MLTCATKQTLEHIAERHGPSGDADSNFDHNFLLAQGGYGPIMKEVFEKGQGAAEYDNSNRLVYRYYYNFNTRTGTGLDRDGSAVVFKGVEMIGTAGNQIFWVETMFPKGILKV